ncbi:nucleotidyltransferase family protein [Gimesia algae]|uniref:Molybdopterin-guanine dinucleotide biosynthesis protein MobA n=1 Tax=Gimesia algae TaxID=2527971 RepID=A0A517VHA5_9PLAN|nr:nucleotidyltransferase family protein [Gimesia algae]QDT92365.1 molybdopterin-guanine dinucleotide biosynthesis protein MobA [Gimesia algae]
MTTRRLFAIVPAAGRSRRMGTHKLLLTLGAETVIQRLVRGLSSEGITKTVIVARQDDIRLKDHLADLQVDVVQRETDPPDMKASVQYALRWIEEHYQPADEDGWLLVPADHPVLEQSVIDELCQAWERCPADVMIPTYQGRKGHPTFFRWSMADRIFKLSEAQGINALWPSRDIQPFLQECAVPEILLDLDTPEDFDALQKKYGTD